MEKIWRTLPQDTREVLSSSKTECGSRSLLLERFADPRWEGDKRKEHWKRVIEKSKPCMAEERRMAWLDFVLSACGPDDLLFGRLRSRLMVNMAGGVMENAGLCLDRFGLPYIPGSAVKGCARRAAIRELRDLQAAPAEKAAVLESIALVFGWTGDDWEKENSDFCYGCGPESPVIRQIAAQRLCEKLGIEPDPGKPCWRSLHNFAGRVRFLPAHPHDPAEPRLALEVVTSHHRDYYQGKRDAAFDDEDPNPVLFPAVAPGSVFLFALPPAPRGSKELQGKAKKWLRMGLEKEGIGAKTAAGYGWFDCSEELQEQYRAKLEEDRREQERAKARAGLEPDPAWLQCFSEEKEDRLRGRIKKFKEEEKHWSEADRDERYQLSLFHFLTVVDTKIYKEEQAKAKSDVLKALKNLAQKFGRKLP